MTWSFWVIKWILFYLKLFIDAVWYWNSRTEDGRCYALYYRLDSESTCFVFRIIFQKIDKDQDGLVTDTELQEWIRHVQRRYVETETERQWKEHITNRNADPAYELRWPDYLKRTYGSTEGLYPPTLLYLWRLAVLMHTYAHILAFIHTYIHGIYIYILWSWWTLMNNLLVVSVLISFQRRWVQWFKATQSLKRMAIRCQSVVTGDDGTLRTLTRMVALRRKSSCTSYIQRKLIIWGILLLR